ncbi:MAG: hypothetical protein OXH28_02780 [bacterium]|nr:hypothetical protein [bacterium]MXV91036.1 hypothetical protein [Acidimicrobiia bacterium]MYC44611.1 hypothetical protein [Acidimicrobiia bacterium]
MTGTYFLGINQQQAVVQELEQKLEVEQRLVQALEQNLTQVQEQVQDLELALEQAQGQQQDQQQSQNIYQTFNYPPSDPGQFGNGNAVNTGGSNGGSNGGAPSDSTPPDSAATESSAVSSPPSTTQESSGGSVDAPLSVRLASGDSAQGRPGCSSRYCRELEIDLGDAPAGVYSVECWSSRDQSQPWYQTAGRSAGWRWPDSTLWQNGGCYFGYPGEQVWVVVNGNRSNTVTWPS